MHGNSEMQKINQTSAMPEKTDVHWSGRFSVAPMLDWTDRHCRYFLRLLSRNTLLYTEMVTTGAIIHGKGENGNIESHISQGKNQSLFRIHP